MSEIVLHAELMAALSIEQAVNRYNAVIEFTKTVMKKDKDYGVIPGTDKPTLLKPGAEKLCSLFGMVPDFTIIDKITDFNSGLFYFQYRCTLLRDGNVVGAGLGSCNSREKKYRYRNVVEWKATEEEKTNAIRTETRTSRNGKDYKVYIIENAEPFDLVNTLDKMAQKRALIAATLIAANASEFFTQDVEDMDIIAGEYSIIEPEIEEPKQPAPKKVAKKETNGNGDKRSWDGTLVHAIVLEKLADNPQNAVAMLNLSNIDAKNTTVEECVSWAREYRGHRDEGLETDEAAGIANMHYRAMKEAE